MLSIEENQMLTETDPGTPMGELFRRFWMPAMLSEELPGADCPPVRLRLLGENLVGFRDSNGTVGVLDAYCPHRGAPLFFGRNEACGLRCVYHGWKFDVQGRCVDIPNAPEGVTYKDKVRIKSYAVIERAGLIWVYMGPPDKQPPFYRFEWLDTPDSHRFIQKLIVNCHLVSSDEAIIRVRRNILKAARDLSKGIEPALAQTPEVARVLPGRMVLPPDADVAAALRPHMQARP